MTIAAIIAGRDHDVIAATKDMTVAQVVSLLASKRIGAVPVMADGEVVGIFSERDVVYRLASEGAAMLDWPVEKVMTAPAITVEPGTTVLAALSMMTRRRIRHLPVVSGGAVSGFVSIGDLVKYRIERIEQEASAMREYISSV